MTEENSRKANPVMANQFSTSVFNQAPHGIILINKLGTIEFLNYRAGQLVELEPKDAVGKQLQEIFKIKCQGSEAKVEAIIKKAFRSKKIIDLAPNCLLVSQSGKQIPIKIKIAPVRNEIGKVAGIIISIFKAEQDSSVKRKLNKFRRRTTKLQKLARAGFWELDLQSNRLFWSNEVFRIFEIEPSEFGASLESFLNLVHPEDRQKVANAYETSVKKHLPYEIEHRILTSSGKIKYVREHCETLYDKDGRPLRSIGTVQDITDLIEVEQKLLQSEQKSQTILDAITDTILILDKNGVILEVYNHETNPLPVSTNIFLGKRYSDIITKEAADLITQSIEKLIKTKTPQTFESHLNRDNNEKQYFEVIVSLLGDDKFVAVARDITLRKKLEMELEYIRNFKRILLQLAIEFIDVSPEKFEEEKEKALEMIVDFLKVDRVYIFDYDFDKRTMSNTYEKCMPGISPQIDNLQDIPMDLFPDWVNSHLNGDLIHIPKVSALPDGHNLKNILEAQDIKTLITFPIIHKNQCYGFLGFDSVKNIRKWTPAEIDLLKLFANLLANAENHKRIELKAKKDYEQITFLVSEIHHRVKNNLQVIASLLHLQSRTLKDKEVAEFVKETKNRISMIATVHEMLYKTKTFAAINFKEYMKNIIAKEITYSDLNKRIKLELEIEDVMLAIDDAIPISILLHELISNSMKHAFPGDRKGIIRIIFQQLDKENYQLIYQDNGVGLPEHIDFYTTNSFGLQLIRMLANQIEGKVTLKQNGWTTFSIVFMGYGHAKKHPDSRR